MIYDPFYTDNPLNQYNLDRNIRLKSNYYTATLSFSPYYLGRFYDIICSDLSQCALGKLRECLDFDEILFNKPYPMTHFIVTFNGTQIKFE